MAIKPRIIALIYINSIKLKVEWEQSRPIGNCTRQTAYCVDGGIQLLIMSKQMRWYMYNSFTLLNQDAAHQLLILPVWATMRTSAAHFPMSPFALAYACSIFMCLMISNCSGEHSSSRMASVKNKLRSTMTDERLSTLELCRDSQHCCNNNII